MKPFYQTKLGKLYNGNCLSILTDFKDNEAGALITDPPYSSGGQFRSDRIKTTLEKYKGRTKKQYLEFHGDNKDQRAFYKWSSWWMAECYRIIKPGAPACVFTDWRQLPITTDAFQAAGFVWRGIAVWDKTEGTRPVKGRFRNQCEYVVWGTKGAAPAQGKCFPGLLRQCNSGPKKHHLAGKPENIIEWLVQIAKDGYILDPFIGSGTTAVVSERLRLNWIGIEIDKDIACDAAERIAKSLKKSCSSLKTIPKLR